MTTNESTGTVIELTREFVAAAIESEAKLFAGEFVGYDNRDAPAAGCAVCAVGAVMRLALAEDTTGGDVVITCSNATSGGRLWAKGARVGKELATKYAATEVADGHPMNALSYLFESLAKDTSDYDEIRRDVVAFVRSSFPPVVRVNINGFAPAADVYVVSR